MSQFRIGQSDFFSSEETSHFVFGNLTVRKAPYLGGLPGYSSPLFRWWGTTFKINILCFLFCCLRRIIRIKKQAVQPDGYFPQINAGLALKGGSSLALSFSFSAIGSSSLADPWSRSGSLSGSSSWPGSSTGPPAATNSSSLFWASCLVSVLMDGSWFPACRYSFCCRPFNAEASAAFLAEFWTAFDLLVLSTFFFFLSFLAIFNWSENTEPKKDTISLCVFAKRIKNCLTS